MKKNVLLLVFGIALAIAVGFQQGVAASFVAAEETEEAVSIQAYLFLSNTCPWCRKLKQEGFATKFRQKYAGRVNFKEYEIHTPQGKQQFGRLIKKHGLSGGVPVLIIGDTVLQGYSADLMTRANAAVQKERKKARPVKKTAKKKEKNLPAVISITMEDEELQGVAPAQDMERIRQYVSQVQEENGETLSSMNNAFSLEVCNRAMAIVNTNEEKLKKLAAKSPTFASFKKSAAVIKAGQETQLNELMRKSTKSLR
jgi:hypothetical protein